METNRICPNCHKPLATDVPLGLCPECLIKSGLHTGTAPGAPEAVGARFVPPPVAEIAQLFPQLEILEFIGKGGMGAVYKARQPGLDRLVALKILPPAAAGDPGFAERFNREARALARLNHPNIVAVHDFGQAGALHYLVMEFVDGANLRQVERARETVARASAGDRAADLRGAAIRPRRRHRPSRHQAREHPARQKGPGEDHRLRHRQDPGREYRPGDADGREGRGRHAALHGARSRSRSRRRWIIARTFIRWASCSTKC